MTEKLLIARINAKIQPMHRGDYEDTLDEVLKAHNYGEVTGGGTQLAKNGEIAFCELEIILNQNSKESIDLIIKTLEEIGAPKGSFLYSDSIENKTPFGKTEGLAIYLNGTDLSAEVYEKSDINFLYDEISSLIEPLNGKIQSYHEMNTETALYMYGSSADAMKTAIADLVASYPLCKKSRLVKLD